MSALDYKMIQKEIPRGSFDCGNSSINSLVENSYLATLSQQGYTYQILHNDIVVGYYMISLRNIGFEFCPEEITDYYEADFGDFFASVFLNYIAIDKKYQNHGLGKMILKTIISKTLKMVESIPIRLITLDAVQDRAKWYEDVGFAKMKKDITGQEGYNVFMYIDCLKQKNQLIDYCNSKIGSF